jgi:hypothetical protein
MSRVENPTRVAKLTNSFILFILKPLSRRHLFATRRPNRVARVPSVDDLILPWITNGIH